MVHDQEHEQPVACDGPVPVQDKEIKPWCAVSTCSLQPVEETEVSDSTDTEDPDPLTSWPEHESSKESEEFEETEKSLVVQPAVTTSTVWVGDTPASEAVSARKASLLPLFDEQRYQFSRLLNHAVRSGGQIELYLDTLTDTPVAVKRVPALRLKAFPTPNAEDLEDPWQEMAATTYLGGSGPGRVPGVCACHGAFRSTSGDSMLVSDYLLGGDLFDVASTLGEPGPGREQQAWPMIRSLLEAVLTIHSRGVAHGDISLENIMRQRGCSMTTALVDFGMAVTGDLTRTTGVRGKPSYQAPEMHTQHFYDARCADLFACGVVAFSLATGSYPWTSTRPGSCLCFGYALRHGIEAFLQRRKISVGGVRKPVSCCLSVTYRQLLLTLLSSEPLKRFEVSSWQFMRGGVWPTA
mmetsp:Transcript_108526/g.215506  ORF Transcript_108526/g.215506 Transcript_108526/m.215506 type:complete len:409 (+) Transcript_108526:61-1287(+)